MLSSCAVFVCADLLVQLPIGERWPHAQLYNSYTALYVHFMSMQLLFKQMWPHSDVAGHLLGC